MTWRAVMSAQDLWEGEVRDGQIEILAPDPR